MGKAYMPIFHFSGICISAIYNVVENSVNACEMYGIFSAPMKLLLHDIFQKCERYYLHPVTGVKECGKVGSEFLLLILPKVAQQKFLGSLPEVIRSSKSPPVIPIPEQCVVSCAMRR